MFFIIHLKSFSCPNIFSLVIRTQIIHIFLLLVVVPAATRLSWILVVIIYLLIYILFCSIFKKKSSIKQAKGASSLVERLARVMLGLEIVSYWETMRMRVLMSFQRIWKRWFIDLKGFFGLNKVEIVDIVGDQEQINCGSVCK